MAPGITDYINPFLNMANGVGSIATANTENDFPAIAQGIPKYMKERPLEFFRGADDPNPAADTSDKHCL